jgi:hypothetical protein
VIAGAAEEVLMQLDLNDKEMSLLVELLVRGQEELRREIHHTDSRAFKLGLKTNEALVEGLLVKLRTPADVGM